MSDNLKKRSPLERLTIAETLIQSVMVDLPDALDSAYAHGYTAAEADFHEQKKEIIDPVDLVRDLADRIGIHQLYAIALDLRGEPVRKKGKWLTEYLDGIPGRRAEIIYCSECCQVKPYRTPFCPNCGASMQTDDYDDIDWLANERGKFDDVKGEQE